VLDLSGIGHPEGVYTSTLAVFGDNRRLGGRRVVCTRDHSFGVRSHQVAGDYEIALPMAQAGLPLVIVQPGVVYGPGDPSVIGDLLRQYCGAAPHPPHGAAFC